MNTWLTQVIRSLTMGHLASPIVPVECMRTDRLVLVTRQVADHLDRQRRGRSDPRSNRASVLVHSDQGVAGVAILDRVLESPSWLEFRTEDDDRMEFDTRSIEPRCLVEPGTNFINGIERLLELNPGLADVDEDFCETTGLCLVVKNGESFVGALSSEHFLRAVAVRVAVLSLLLEIEELIVDIAQAEPEGGLGRLSPNKRAELINRTIEAPKDAPSLPEADQLAWMLNWRNCRRALAKTYFVDKMTIARKSAWCWADYSNTKRENMASGLITMRNWCAHTPSEYDDKPMTLAVLLQQVLIANDLFSELRGVRARKGGMP